MHLIFEIVALKIAKLKHLKWQTPFCSWVTQLNVSWWSRLKFKYSMGLDVPFFERSSTLLSNDNSSD